MLSSQALSPRRIARTLVSILVLTLIQTVAPTIVIPQIVTPKAEAVDVSYASFPGGTDVLVPSGATSVTITVRGAAGGTGGADGATSGLGSSAVGYVTATFAVVAGDRLLLYPGGAGGNGLTGGSAAGGTAGSKSNPMNVSATTSSFKVGGTWGSSYNFNGGTGGATGSYGSSGSGGGGGAASFVALNENILAVAGGGGGGGGAGNGSSNVPVANPNYTPNGTNALGANGATPTNCGVNLDGGGGGGGGGGWYGGTGGAATVPSGGSECSGTGGSRGGNHVASNATTSTNTTTAANGAGFITYEFTFASTSACVTDVQTNDIYTIVRVNSTTRCTWSVPATVSVVDLFLVGGGAGGAGDSGGGGGGGAILSRTAVAISPSTILTLKVGYGGAASNWAFPSDAYAGDSTTVTTSSNITYSALGGARSVNGNVPGGAGGLGGIASNGGFSGGAGGAGGTCFNVGSIGKTGATNYYYASVLEYGGGGGGGSCPSGAATIAAAGVSGGGSGGFASSATVNQPGTNGIDGRGGGGGGGVATGSGMKLPGGKGGSGIILIRYATNAADAFPASVASAIAGRWLPSDLQTLDSDRKAWIDSSGTYGSVAVTGTPSVTTQGTTDNGFTTGSSRSNLVVTGATGDKVTLVAGALSNYSMFHVARYIRGTTMGRLITANAGNFISGHYNSGNDGVAHHNNAWLTPTARATEYKWLLSTDMAKVYRANGEELSYRFDQGGTAGATGPTGLGINNYGSELTAWQMTEVLLFNRQLTGGEVRLVESYMARIYGLTLDSDGVSAETDTAASFTAGEHFFVNYGIGNTLNDTFTIQAWIRTDDACPAICQIVVKEGTVLLGIQSGTLRYMLTGTTVGGVAGWFDTGISIKAQEWHHVAMVKQFTGDRNGSLLFYLDGKLAYTVAGTPYQVGTNNNSFSSSWKVADADNNWTYLGLRAGSTQKFYGLMDEIKIWRVARTAAQIESDMHSSDGSDSGLQLYFDFNKPVGASTIRLPNLASNGIPATSLFAGTSTQYVETAIRTVTAGSPYTTITFPRTYITQFGGWKVPETVTAASVLVVGGGGGGAGQYTSQTAQNGGGGGGGGVFEIGNYSLIGNSSIPVVVGSGGAGGPPSSTQENGHGRRGGTTSFNTSLTAGGGGGGMFTTFNQMNGANGTAGGGGGGSTGYWNAFDQGIGGTGSSITIGSSTYAGRNGGNGQIWTGSNSGAGGGAGGNATITTPGAGISSSISGIAKEYGRGGTSEAVTTPAYVSTPIAPGNGGDGYRSTNPNGGFGVSGADGVVILRYITSARPSYTKPTNAYLNVGMTETFTTNVLLDSATAMLTRTFKWESSTAGAGGPFTTIKQGTGASNAFFSWIPTDTSTTGSNFLYRLTVTDSDTAGLSISDSSTAFAVINGALRMTGVTSIKKQINVARNETFTISSGTPTYRYTLTPVIPGITLDTATVGSAVLRISDTASVGTYLETLTVTDSVSASVVIPLSITVSAPPNLVDGGEINFNNQIFNIDPGNSASYNRSTGAISDISGTKKTVLVPNGATYSNDFSGVLTFASASSQYMSARAFTQYNTWTIETWIRLDAAPAEGFCPLSSEYNPTNISFALCVDSVRTFYAGFHNGNWTYKRSNEVIPIGTWTHLIGTFNGSEINVYINGVQIGVRDSSVSAGTTPPQPSTDRIFMNKYFATAVGTPPSATYGAIRMYSVGFTQADVSKNYNATKDRFAASNLNQLKPSQKYGTLNIETFTVTSGGDTKTVTFATGNRTGISWDTTSIPGQVKLSVQESLTPGTYYDTITVTDNFSQSTTLPITFSVSKADTITVTAGVATSQVFNNQQATSLPAFAITGLVGSDTGTVTRKYTGVDWTKTCAQGGGCEVGDTGPGGGTIFYISPTVINSASGISSGGRYLEVAPLNWSGLLVESTTAWSRVSTSVAGTSSAIGSGAENTRLINTALTTNSVAAKIAADLNFGTKSDWFLPSTLELKEMYDALYAPSLAGNLSVRNYWSSTQDVTVGQTGRADTYWFGSGGLVSPTDKLGTAITLRPIRAYSPDTVTVLTVPTNVDSYTVSVDTITMTTGLLSYYENVIFQRSGLDITKARQDSLTVTSNVGTFGTPFTLTIRGGSGSGAVTTTFTADSSATGCTITSLVISTTTAGSCNLQLKKAYSRNYFTETATPVIYLLQFVINQPAPSAGSGPNVALSGENKVTVDIDLAPVISSLSTYAATAGSTALIIYGVGFNGSDPLFELKFWRGIAGTGYTINPEKTQISVTVPAGTRTGKVTVTTSKGLAVSEFPLVVTP